MQKSKICLKRGFTLIEVLVVLAILGFFVAMMAKVFTKQDDQRRFDETRIRMEEIKKAILGSEGAYANGQRQFSGYAADMGGVPAIVDILGTPAVTSDDQPAGLWTRDLDDDGVIGPGDIQDAVVWAYQPTSKTWMGWRGPYIEAPPSNFLRDGWGNSFIFTRGDLVVSPLDNNTYRCITLHTSAGVDPSGDPANWQQAQPNGAFGETWIAIGKEYSPALFNVTTLGANGVTEGTGFFDEDITIIIKQTEYMAPVAGRVNGGVTNVRIYYPVAGVEISRIFPTPPLSLSDGDYFRFESTAPAPGDIDVPVGLRSIAVSYDSGATWSTDYIFTVEPTGNWLGTID